MSDSINRQARPAGMSLFFGLSTLFMLAMLLSYLKILFLPLILAVLLCCLLNPLVQALQNRGAPRFLAVFITLALGLGLVWVAFNFILTSLYSFRDGLPGYMPRLRELQSQLSNFRNQRANFLTLELIQRHLSSLSLGDLVGGVLNSFLSFAGYLLLTAIFVLYFLPSLPRLPGKIRSIFPDERGNRLCLALEKINHQVQSYILAKTVLSLGLGLVLGLICYLFGVDFPTTWGIFAFFLNFIPTLGAVLAALLPVMLCFLQLGWSQALWLALALGAVMLISGNFLEPMVLGRSVNLSPTAALLAILAWGWLWGGVGMIIAVPATAVIKFSLDNIESLKPIGGMMGNQ
jgi:predicted PurR-regulated permease PerM